MEHLKQLFLFVLFTVFGIGQIWGATKTVTYTVTSTSSVSTTGTAPDGSSVTFSNTFTTKDQITAGNSMTLTLSNFKVKVTNFTFSMHSNSSKGKGNLSYKVDNGSETFLVGTSSTSQTAFNSWGDNTSYGTSYRDVKWDVVDFTPTSGFVVYVRCVGQNSIYCQSFTITYEESESTKPVVSFDPVAGEYTSTQNVTLTSSVQGATIYYTTNGSNPTTSSPVYSTPIAVSSTTTIKAFAKKDNTSGDVATATYTISIPVAVTGVSLNKNATSIENGENETLVATVAPDNASNKNVTWETSDNTIATVSNGVVTASSTKTGTATITCRSVADNTKYAECEVTVTAPEGDIIKIEDISFSSSSYSDWSSTISKTYASYKGNSNNTTSYIQLRNQSSAGIVSVTSGGSIKKVKVKWANSIASSARYVTIYGKNTAYEGPADLYDNNKVGTELGTITQSSVGTTDVFVYDGSKGNFAYVGVKASGALYFTPITFVWESTPTHEFTYGIKSGDESKGDVEASVSSGSQVEEGATVTLTPSANPYYQVKAVDIEGEETITPTVNDGVYSFTMPTSDVIAEVSFEYIPVTSVTLNKTATTLIVGASETLSVTEVLPATALGSVTWSSSNSEVASVNSETGEVTAVAASADPVTITATSTVTNTVKGTCAVTVTAPTGNPVTISQTTGGTVAANVDVTDVLEGVSITLTATPDAGYTVSGWTIEGVDAGDLTISEDKTTCTFNMPNSEVLAETSFTHEVAVLKLSANGKVTTFESETIHYWKESITLPTTASKGCDGKVFQGWDSDENCSSAPTYAPGDSYIIPNKGNNTIYAVYAEGGSDELTITPSAVTDGDDPHTYTIDKTGYSLTANKNTGSTAPAYNSTASDARIYAKGTITLTAPSNMTSIVFNISTQGMKRLAPITASVGTIATQASGDDKVTWTGDASSVTFTVGDNANYGSDGASKAGQLCFETIDVEVSSDYSNYSTTCVPLPVVVIDPTTINASSDAVTNGLIEADYENVNTSDITVFLYDDAACQTAFSGNWLTASPDASNNISYTLTENTSYTDARTAYIKLTAPGTGAVNPEIVIIPVTQAKKAAVFTSVSEFINYVTNNSVTSLSNVTVTGVITEIITAYSSQYYNVSFNIADDFNSNSVQLQGFRTKDGTSVSAAATLAEGDRVTLKGNYTLDGTTHKLAANNTIEEYTAKELSSVVVSGTANKTTYSSEDNAFSFAGLTATATYSTGYTKDVTAEATWTTNLGEGDIVTETGDVNVTATFGGQTSDAAVVAVTFTSKTVASISLSYTAITTYVGHDFLKPTVTAHYEEEIADEVVTEGATFDEEAYNKNTADTYTIGVSYKGKEASYDITVKEIGNEQATAYTAAEINDIIATCYKSTSVSDYDVYVKGIVVEDAHTVSGNSVYHISADGTETNQFYIFGAKYFDLSTSANGNVKAGDDVIVKGKIQNYNSNTPELKNSTVVYQLREGALDIADIAEFEVGTADIADTDLTITTASDGDITFTSGNEAVVTIVEGKLHAVAAGTATITANLAATANEGAINYTAANTTFDVTVIAAKARYAVTFDMDGGSADPEMSLGDQLENANIVIPAGTYTKDGYKFNGWVVTAGETPIDVTKTGNVYSFTMPAAAVTVTAQWVEGVEFEWIAKDQGYTNNTAISSASESPIVITFAKSTGSNNPTFYGSGITSDAVRMYKNNTVTISTAANNKLMTGVTITFDSGNTSLSGNGLSVAGTTGTWSGLAKELVFTNTTSGSDKAYVKAIAVTYTNGTVTTLDINDVSLKLSEETKNLSISCNVTPTPAISYEIATADQAIATVEDGVVTAQSVGGPINVTARIAQGSNYTAAVANFTITVTDKTPTVMSFPQVSYVANLGSDFEEPVLTTNPTNLSISYSSSVEAVATVDASTGVVTLKAEGTTVITASFAGNDDYAANSATYTLNVIDPTKDVLTAALIGKSSYESWSDKTFGSGVKYAGNSTTGSGNIQLRAGNESGIVTTTKIGYLKKLTATRGNNTSGHYAEIYAKSTAYESAADLYDVTKCGTLIGILPETGECELAFESGAGYDKNYKYIGIKSKTGAVYYSDITIRWEPAEFVNYSITYKAGEGTGDDVVLTDQESGTTISLASKPDNFEYSGHVFAGWKLENTTEETRSAGSSYTVNTNTVFVAQWNPLYTVTYQAGEGATGEDVIVENVHAGNYTLAGKPEGFTKGTDVFRGWKLNNAGNLLEVGDNYELSSNVTFVAQWDVEKQEAGLAYTTATYTIQLGEAFEAQELTNPYDLTVTYAGNNDVVATVNANTGAITLQGGTGTVTITASSAATTGYYEGSASYKLTVVNFADGIWELVSDASTLAAGDFLVIGSKDNDATAGDISSQVMLKVNSKIFAVGNSSYVIPTLGEGTKVLQLGGENGAWTLTNESRALGATAAKKMAWNNGTQTWSISISNCNATITNGTSSYGDLQYNSGSPRFTTYATSQAAVQLYRLNSEKIAVCYVAGDISSTAPTNAFINKNSSITLPATPTSTNGYTFKGWSVNGELKTAGATIENITSTLVIYAKWEIVIPTNTEEPVSAETLEDKADVTVPTNGSLVVNSDKDLGTITVQSEATVTISANANTENIVVENKGEVIVDGATAADSLTVNVGGKITISEGKKLKVNKKFILKSTMASGNSGQVAGTTYDAQTGETNFEIAEGEDAFYDLTLGDGGRNDHWHAFTVPFPVDVMNGIYDMEGNKLQNEVNYAIMEYHGDLRAQGQYGWKKIRSTLVPGTFYLMATDGRANYRLMKKAGEPVVAANNKSLSLHASDQSTNAGWNGVGNPTLSFGTVNYLVYVLNPSSYTYEHFEAGEKNFVVGTPFFIQANAAAVAQGMQMGAVNNEKPYYAPARVAEKNIDKVKVFFGNDEYQDKLTILASEEATNEYEIGEDMVKMTMTNTPTVAQIFGNAYGSKLCRVYAPMHNDMAEYSVSLYAPANGTYTMSAPEVENADVFLTFEGSIIWNLAESAYELDLDKGTTEGYGLIMQAKAPQITTGISGTDADAAGVQKVVINDHVYILRGGEMYDVTGKAVK